MTAFRAVLFDFDGTLARTLEDHFNAWQVSLRRHGVELSAEDYYPLEGTAVHELARLYARRLPGLDPAVLVREKEEWYLDHHHFELYAGVEDFIDTLRASHVPLGIVTAARRDRLDRSVPAAFLAKFDAIVTSDSTPRGKPHPDGFLQGAAALGVRAEECVVVENAPLGVTAAKAARSYCVAIASTMASSWLRHADCVVESFQELPTLGVFTDGFREPRDSQPPPLGVQPQGPAR